MVRKDATEVLIATVGSEPQVVSWLLECLIDESLNINEVALIYTSSPNILASIEILETEFTTFYHPRIELNPILIGGENAGLDDFRTDEDVNIYLQTIYNTIKSYKQSGAIIHLSIAGGRKVMGIMAMVAAQILFGPKDRAWYLFTEGWSPGDSRELHLSTGNRHKLLEVPVLRLEESYLLLGMSEFMSPTELIHWQENLLKNKKMRRCREFVEHWLTKAERKVALLACQGADNTAIAKQLIKQERTVANQLTSIYGKLQEWLDYPEHKVDRRTLIAELAPYFSLKHGDEGKLDY